jgi:hypothetical protein
MEQYTLREEVLMVDMDVEVAEEELCMTTLAWGQVLIYQATAAMEVQVSS